MKIDIVPGNELTPDLAGVWSDMVCADTTFDSPYFYPEFTQAVATVRCDVEIAVLQHDQQTIGFFPFQRDRRNVGGPVGGFLSDFQAAITKEDRWHAKDLLQGCQLSAWKFDHLLAEQRPFREYHYGTAESPYIDLSQGFDCYKQERILANSQLIKQTERKSRKIEREIGPLSFEFHISEAQVFHDLCAWKSDQYKRTNQTDIFRIEWVFKLLDVIRDKKMNGFSGLLSALYAGDNLIAAHLGMRTKEVLHIWFPTYNVKYSKYSPGLIMLMELAKAGSANGINRIDLGKGPERYKYSLKSGSIPLAHGVIDRHLLTGQIRRSLWTLRRRVANSRLNRLREKVRGI